MWEGARFGEVSRDTGHEHLLEQDGEAAYA